MDVRKILGNTKYLGLWTWGATTTVRDSQGRKRQRPAAPDKAVQVERPDLRIIDNATWQKAQARLQELGKIFGQKPDQKRRGMPVNHPELYPATESVSGDYAWFR